MTVTHYPLDRTASHLVLQLNDLRINERVANVNDHKQLDQFMPDPFVSPIPLSGMVAIWMSISL